VRRQYVKREVQQHAGPNESDQSDIL